MATAVPIINCVMLLRMIASREFDCCRLLEARQHVCEGRHKSTVSERDAHRTGTSGFLFCLPLAWRPARSRKARRLMPLTMRATGVESGIDKDRADYVCSAKSAAYTKSSFGPGHLRWFWAQAVHVNEDGQALIGNVKRAPPAARAVCR
jgi:hypothetical protein